MHLYYSLKKRARLALRECREGTAAVTSSSDERLPKGRDSQTNR
jgi:hypothetical protein